MLQQEIQHADQAPWSDSAQQPRHGDVSSRPRLTTDEVDRVVRVWTTLTETFGESFTRQYGDVPPDLWALTIAALSEQECFEGIRRLAMQGREWPPNLGQLVAACRPPRAGVRFLGRPVDPRRALPRTAARPEHRDQCLARMRRRLTGVEEEMPHSEKQAWNTRACTCRGEGTCPSCRFFGGIREAS